MNDTFGIDDFHLVGFDVGRFSETSLESWGNLINIGNVATILMPGSTFRVGGKLAGEQKPRGWGLFLIEHMVDAMDVTTDDEAGTQTVSLRMAREETSHG